MKMPSDSPVLGLILIALTLLAPTLPAQGPPGPPPGPPADTMKSLQEIWDEIVALKGQVTGLEAQNAALLQQLNALTATPGSGFPMEFVDILDAGFHNPDPLTGKGQAIYAYRIGKYEVTNAQYAAFLNSVAATDTNALYNTLMGSNARGGIKRSGASGSYTYEVKPAMGNKPVNYVSWYDALRFCNWLHNGQPSGAQDGSTTEDGAYTLTGTTSIGTGTDPTHGANGRNAGAHFWLPSENEWYKAAYYQPYTQGGDADHYWLYPTQSNTAPTVATADGTGNIDNDSGNIANYLYGADWNGQDGNVTAVGSGGAGSQSYYGAADMGGNVWEWNENTLGGARMKRGGGHDDHTSGLLQSSFRGNHPPAGGRYDLGFRVAGP